MEKDYNFFKPLTGVLKNYRRLKVGRYRMIYKIKEEKVVWIVAVGIRIDQNKIDIYEIFKKLNKGK